MSKLMNNKPPTMSAKRRHPPNGILGRLLGLLLDPGVPGGAPSTFHNGGGGTSPGPVRRGLSFCFTSLTVATVSTFR